MRRKTRNFGHLKIFAVALLVGILLPKFIDTNATGNLGDFEAGETGIKLCALITSGGLEQSLRFSVVNNQGFSSDVLVEHNTCKTIPAVAATYTIRQYVSQEYTIDSVSGGTVSADNTPFIATAAGQYTVIYSNDYSKKGYLHTIGYTSTTAESSAVEVTFDANGGTGTMQPQHFGLNNSQALTVNAFAYTGYTFSGWNTEPDGSGSGYTNGESLTFSQGGELTLYAQWTAASYGNAYTTIQALANNPAQQIDFRSGATTATGNGNGVNEYTENNQSIYYFRGDVTNNNVVWGGLCWKIVRTTATSGIKMIYNGTATQNGTSYECNATDTQISVNNDSTLAYNTYTGDNSPADLGYMVGSRITLNTESNPGTYIFSKAVSRSGNTYTLDTATGQSTTGSFSGGIYNPQIPSDYRYFCTDGQSSCDDTKIAYATAAATELSYYLIGGYDDIEGAVEAMFVNTTDSTAKSTIESWFVAQNLDQIENQLEDAIFCNDRTVSAGTLKGMSETYPSDGLNTFASRARNTVDVNNNYAPSLDCANKDDAFTANDTVYGNAKLGHKVGLLTADELTLAGINATAAVTNNYLDDGNISWTMTPNYEGAGNNSVFTWSNILDDNSQNDPNDDTSVGLRPVVSLNSMTNFAQGGAGTTSNPYVVE